MASNTHKSGAHDVEAAFAAACDALEPLREGASLLLGCSAGGDSMALLHLMLARAPQSDWRLTVAHFDHAQRTDSGEETTELAIRCAALEVNFLTSRMTESPAETPASEDFMRRARFGFFGRAMDQSGAEALVLAHQADDRAETFLMRLLAGSGPTGLSSIRRVETVEGMTIARPLLGLRRAELREYLGARDLSWREDPANEDERFKRVWVRKRVLPLFAERMGRDVTDRIVRTTELVEEEAGALGEACEVLLGELACAAEEPARTALNLDHKIWREAGAPLRRRLMRQWLWKLRSAPHPPGYAAVAEALKFAERGERGTRLRTIERIHLERRAGRLMAYPPEPRPAQENEKSARNQKG